MDKIYIAFRESIFCPKDIIQLLSVAPNTATSYINKFLSLNALDKIEDVGQSKYRFRK